MFQILILVGGISTSPFTTFAPLPEVPAGVVPEFVDNGECQAAAWHDGVAVQYVLLEGEYVAEGVGYMPVQTPWLGVDLLAWDGGGCAMAERG